MLKKLKLKTKGADKMDNLKINQFLCEDIIDITTLDLAPNEKLEQIMKKCEQALAELAKCVPPYKSIDIKANKAVAVEVKTAPPTAKVEETKAVAVKPKEVKAKTAKPKEVYVLPYNLTKKDISIINQTLKSEGKNRPIFGKVYHLKDKKEVAFTDTHILYTITDKCIDEIPKEFMAKEIVTPFDKLDVITPIIDDTSISTTINIQEVKDFIKVQGRANCKKLATKAIYRLQMSDKTITGVNAIYLEQAMTLLHVNAVEVHQPKVNSIAKGNPSPMLIKSAFGKVVITPVFLAE